ncbi:MAG: RNA 2',3'-cyclic phosphodiesterase [Inquilinaceae bacterium]
MLRLFVALPVPEPIRRHLALLEGGVPGARWIEADNLHVTLRFLGEIGEDRAADLDAALARIAAPPVALTVAGVGLFGTPRRARMLWAGIERTDPLRALHDRVDRAAVAAGLPPDDRKFMPHITLARLRQAPMERVGRWLADHALAAAGAVTVDRFVLYRSHLGGEGAFYEPLRTYPLKPPRGR